MASATPSNAGQIGRQLVYHADCLEILPFLDEGSVDVIVTSPPYNVGTPYGEYNDRMPREDYLRWLRRVFWQLHRVLDDRGSLFLNMGWKASDPWVSVEVALLLREVRGERSHFYLQNRISWVKSVAIGENPSIGHSQPINSPRYLNQNWEEIWHFTKDCAVPLNRLALGVPFADKGNLTRGNRGQHGDLRCRGNVWYVPYASPSQDMSDARWLALLLDTEGTIHIEKVSRPTGGRSVSYRSIVSASNTDRRLLETAQSLIGAGAIYNSPIDPNGVVQGRRPIFRLRLDEPDACSLLARVYPYLIVKQRQAKVALHLGTVKRGGGGSRRRLVGEELDLRERLHQVMRALNQGDNPDDSWITEPTISYAPYTGDTLFVPYETIQGREEKGEHPAIFPSQLAEWCIQLHGLREDLLVLDPFAGSMSTLVACHRLGVRGIGIELEEAYARFGRRRLEALQQTQATPTPAEGGSGPGLGGDRSS